MSLRYAILGSLARLPASGYDLLKRFDRKYNFVWWASQGAVYTELQKLLAEDLIDQRSAGGRNRLEHGVTAAGLKATQSWLRSEPARRPRDELILRVFSLWLLPPDESAAFLDQLAERYALQLAEYERRRESGPRDDSAAEVFDQIALEAGIAHETAMLEWARASAAKVREHDWAKAATGAPGVPSRALAPSADPVEGPRGIPMDESPGASSPKVSN